MRIDLWRKDARSRLLSAGNEDWEGDPDWMLCDVLDIRRAQIRFRLEEELNDGELERLESMLSRRLAGEPLQYIEGAAYFMGLRFVVNESVLIPRQDTELIAVKAIAIAGDRAIRVLDLCTGSGILAVSIKLNCRNVSVSASDISREALEVAKKNAQIHGADIDFYQGDLFSCFKGEKFNLIVSNPPYLDDADMDQLQREVAREPRLALYGGENGLDIISRISDEIDGYLNDGGVLLMEIGETQGERAGSMFEGSRILKDLNGKDRAVFYQKN